MRRLHILFVLASCSEQPQAAAALDASTPDGKTVVFDVGAVTSDVGIDAEQIDASSDALTVDAMLLPDASTDASTDALISAACSSTVALSNVGGNGVATWACPGTQLASWHLRIENRDGALFDQLNGAQCPGGSAFISFTYKASFMPLISINRLELADGTTVPCVLP